MTALLARTLSGRMVTAVAEIEGYIQFEFGKDIGLTIYNDCAITPAVPVSSLHGKCATQIAERQDQVCIVFDGAVALTVDLRPQAWRGPEAMELWRSEHPLIVWN